MADSDFYNFVTYPKEIDTQLALIGPSRVQVGKPLNLHIVALGKDGEPCDMPDPPIATCEGPRMPDFTEKPISFTVNFKQVRKGIYQPKIPPSLSKEGYYLFTARDPNGVFLPFGLPVYASIDSPRQHLHWGDLHGHSTLSDGALSPEEYYGWARDVAFLDCVALTDHNWALSEKKIETVRTLANEWYEPGRFVPFFGFEWAMGKARSHPARGRPNHKHLIFRRTDEQFLPWAPWQDTPSVNRLWEMLERRDVIAIPHHTGLPHKTYFGTDWSFHSEKFERLAEVFSDWGSSEMAEDRYPLPEIAKGSFIRNAIALGFHPGFVGGSDTHGSRPGLNAIPSKGHPYALTALTAIEAPTRTRDALWISLYNRRCYATSGGRRHLLDFSIDGAPIGSRLIQPVSLSPRHITVTVAGSTNIKDIIIVKNAKEVASFPGKGWCQKIEWTDNNPSPDREDSYYVRAEMADTSMVWSSPIWVTGLSNRDIAPEPRPFPARERANKSGKTPEPADEAP